MECEGNITIIDGWPDGPCSSSSGEDAQVKLYAHPPEQSDDWPVISLVVHINYATEHPDTTTGASAILDLKEARQLRDALSAMVERLEKGN